MSTQKQIDANRKNAQKSTGPKTPDGKSATAQNAIKHGFTANTPIIPGEDPAAYDTFKTNLLKELNPQGPAESMLADRIIDLSWRLKRSGRLHIAAYHVFAEGSSGILPESETPANPELSIGRIAVHDFSGDKVLEKLLIHERRIENSLYRTITELQRLQFIRTKYQSLLMDHEDYDDWEFREASIRQRIAREEAEFFKKNPKADPNYRAEPPIPMVPNKLPNAN